MLNFCFGNVTLAQDDHGLNEAHNSESDSPVRELETPISPDTVTRAEESETNPNHDNDDMNEDEDDTWTCVERPDPCPAMPSLSGVDKCYCPEAHDICEEGFMCNLYNNSCSLPPPDCGMTPDIADEARCVCTNDESATICEENEYCHLDKKKCKPAPAACPDVPGIAPSAGCSCNASIVCKKGFMCDLDTVTCVERPARCPVMPSLSGVDKCYCPKAHEICEEGLMCNLFNSSCSPPPPDCGEIPDIADDARCVCKNDKNATICQENEMCNSTSVTCSVRPAECPYMPSVSPREGCYCEVSHTLCVEDEMCDNRTAVAKCAPLPEECPPMPGVTYDPAGCYCRFSQSICEAVYMCNARNNTCSIPAKCDDPTSLTDWADLNLDISSKHPDNIFVESVNVTFMCKENTFLTRKVKQIIIIKTTSLFPQDYKFTKAIDDIGYEATCLPTGEWNQIAKCEMIFCNPLDVDDETVENTEFKNTFNMTTHASTLKLSCKENINDFDFGQNILRTFLTCGKT